MSIDERITESDNRLNEAIKNGTDIDVHYWRGYRDGLTAIKMSLTVEGGENG